LHISSRQIVNWTNKIGPNITFIVTAAEKKAKGTANITDKYNGSFIILTSYFQSMAVLMAALNFSGIRLFPVEFD
jgi:hypothetical protein